MALIRRINITEFKVVSFTSDPGIQEEYTGNSWVLNQKTGETITGTEDFYGSVRTSILLAKLESITVNVPNMNVQQFRQVPANALQQYSPGYFTYTEDIGWVELGRSVNSIYYEDCSSIINDAISGKSIIPGRLPVSRDYFDLDFINIPMNGGNLTVVSGEGTGRESTQVIGTYNVNKGLTQRDLVSFGPDPTIYPGMPILGPNEYLPMIINSNGTSLVPGQGGFQDVATLKANISPIDLQIVYRYQIVTESDPNYVGKNSDSSENGILYDDGKKLRWGNSRRVVQNAFPASISGPKKGFGDKNMWETTKDNRSQGECVLFPDKKTSVGTQTDISIPTTELGEDSGMKPDLTSDPDLNVKPEFCRDCPPLEQIPINFPPHDVITQEELSGNVQEMTQNILLNFPKYQENPIEDGANILRNAYQYDESSRFIKDPREFALDNKTIPSGMLQILFNKKNCSFDVFPSLRDKDGDIPEVVGPLVAYYMESVRRDISNTFYLNPEETVIKSIGTGSDSYMRYSDGKSYKELLGQSVLGSGDPISFHKIPEVFVEMYPKEENQWVRLYRKDIERPSSLPEEFRKDSKRVHDKNYISDMATDLLIGVPDEDRWIVTGLNIIAQIKSVSYNWLRMTYYPLPDYFSPSEINSFAYYPSRWKSMMYPIYESISKGNIKFQVDNDRGNIFINKELVLGDWDILWKNMKDENGIEIRNSKNIAYVIDDIISSKVYSDGMVNENIEIQPMREIFGGILDDLISTYTSQYTPRGSNLSIRYPNIIQIAKDVKYINEFGLESFASELVSGLPEEFALKMTKFLVTQIVSAISYDINRKNPSRSSYEVLRIFKTGGVILKSKSGLYSTFKEPSPIIFLGYNDSMKINPDISTLSKNDSVEDLFFVPSNKYKLNSGDSLSTNQSQIKSGNYLKQGTFNQNDVQSMPIIKKRIKYYGRNPLLNIYHLNMADQNWLFKRKENPNFVPFRRGKNTKTSDWPSLNRGQYPSIFPPVWNEPPNVPNIPNNLDARDGWSWGDIAWSDREPNVIIPLKDRWEIDDIETDEDGNQFLILKDKTPILDLYYSLMEMHVKGVSWGEIIRYVNTAMKTVSSVSKGVYSEKIDLEKLNNLLELVQSRLWTLNPDNKIENSPFSLKPLDWGYIDYEETKNLSKKLMLINTTNKQVLIESVFIDEYYDSVYDTPETDTYGNVPSSLFKIESGILPGNYIQPGDIFNIDSKSNPAIPDGEITISFNQNNKDVSIQNGFNYAAKLVIYGEVDGNKFKTYCDLFATPVFDRLNDENRKYAEIPLFTPTTIDFGFLEKDTTSKEYLVYSNMSQTDDIEILSMDLIDQNAYVLNFSGEMELIELENDKLSQSNIVTFYKLDQLKSNKIAVNDTKNYEIGINLDTTIKPKKSLAPNTNVYLNSKLVIVYSHKNSNKNAKSSVTKQVEIQLAGRTLIK